MADIKIVTPENLEKQLTKYNTKVKEVLTGLNNELIGHAELISDASIRIEKLETEEVGTWTPRIKISYNVHTTGQGGSTPGEVYLDLRTEYDYNRCEYIKYNNSVMIVIDAKFSVPVVTLNENHYSVITDVNIEGLPIPVKMMKSSTGNTYCMIDSLAALPDGSSTYKFATTYTMSNYVSIFNPKDIFGSKVEEMQTNIGSDIYINLGLYYPI